MARLSQKQLEELAKQRRLENEEKEKNRTEDNGHISYNPKIINEILTDGVQPPYKYKLPDLPSPYKDSESVPFVHVESYPKINIQGKFSSNRQVKGANLYLLKEIDLVLSKINEGKNKNATINFLIWVGLQSLKGVNHDISIQIHDSTYADGGLIENYILTESNES
ncbi:hypothetical protein [Legionella fairfieldensis]|uniref:hypothetical protein n=1 Tax=Legionella fairfieldensis TaxID=45064 RepID=UPI000490CB23|nr:hypothetical protein [Legionella fairfieldensis]